MKILTIEDVAVLLNIKISRMRTIISQKTIPYFKIGRLVRFDERDVINFLEKQKKAIKR